MNAHSQVTHNACTASSSCSRNITLNGPQPLKRCCGLRPECDNDVMKTEHLQVLRHCLVDLCIASVRQPELHEAQHCTQVVSPAGLQGNQVSLQCMLHTHRGAEI